MTHTKSMTDAEYIRELQADNKRLCKALEDIAYGKMNDLSISALNADWQGFSRLLQERARKAFTAHNWHEEIKDMEAEG